MFGLLLVAVLICKHFIHSTDNYYDLYYSLKLDKVIDSPPPVKIYTERVPPPPTTITSTMGRILDRGMIRVGYDPIDIPFCYLNQWNELVGYDVAYAYQLAKDLDVKLELVPIRYDTLIEDVNNGYCDIVMSAIVMDEQRIIGLEFSNAYIEQSNCLVVPRSKVDKFRKLSSILHDPTIRIGALGTFIEVVKTHFSEKNLVTGVVQDLVDGKVDAYMWAELQAYIWCLAHPEYTTLTYHDELGKKYFAYPMQKTSEQLVHFINEWLQLKQEQGFAYKQRQYWFLGKSYNPELKRWSIIRDVFHWVD